MVCIKDILLHYSTVCSLRHRVVVVNKSWDKDSTKIEYTIEVTTRSLGYPTTSWGAAWTVPQTGT